MKEYLTLSVGVIFLSVMLTFIIPQGKLSKIVGYVIRLVCICVLLQPLTSWLNLTDASYEMADYDYICTVYSSTQSSQLQKQISQNFAVDCICTVAVSYDDGQFIFGEVVVECNLDDEQTKQKIYEYLSQLGYIDINVK